MGASDIQKRGYPKSQIKRDWMVFRFCGGMGAGQTSELLTNTQATYAIEVNPYITYNESVVFRNPEFSQGTGAVFTGVRITMTDGGSDDVTWYLALSTTGTLTDSEILAQNMPFSGELPYDIEVPHSKVPQPTDPNWDNKIYVTIYWGAANVYYGNADYTDNVQYLRIAKHNYEVNQ